MTMIAKQLPRQFAAFHPADRQKLLETKKELQAKAIPLVKKLIDYDAEFTDCTLSVSFVEFSKGLEMWSLKVGVDSCLIGDLIGLAQKLEQFNQIEKEGQFKLADGRLASLGDGDDISAAVFEDGKFRIWLRVWEKGNELGFGPGYID